MEITTCPTPAAHTLEITVANPADCTPDHACTAHDTAHIHGRDDHGAVAVL